MADSYQKDVSIDRFETFLREAPLQKGTKAAYLKEAKRLRSWAGAKGIALASLDGSALVRYLRFRKQSRSQMAMVFSALRSFFSAADLRAMNGPDGRWPKEALEIGIDVPHRIAPQPMFASDADFEHFCSKLDVDNPLEARDLVIVRLLYREPVGLTGLLATDVSDFDPHKGTLRFVSAFRGQPRETIVRLSPESTEALARYLGGPRLSITARSDGPLFPSTRGRLSRQGRWRKFVEYSRRAGIALGRKRARRSDLPPVVSRASLTILQEMDSQLRSAMRARKIDGRAAAPAVVNRSALSVLQEMDRRLRSAMIARQRDTQAATIAR